MTLFILMLKSLLYTIKIASGSHHLKKVWPQRQPDQFWLRELKASNKYIKGWEFHRIEKKHSLRAAKTPNGSETNSSS